MPKGVYPHKSLKEYHKPDCNCGPCKAVRGDPEFLEMRKRVQKELWQDPEYREMQSKAHEGYKESEEAGRKRSKTQKAQYVAGRVPFWEGKHFSAEHCEKIRQRNTGKIRSEEAIENYKKMWENEERKKKWLKAIFKGSKVKPNKPEKFLIKLFQKILPDQWKYIGDGKDEDSIIAGKNPDFIHVNQKKIIEFNGDWWHGEKITGRTKEEEEQQRTDCFTRYGYQTLIIWECELDNIDKIVNKVMEFTYD